MKRKGWVVVRGGIVEKTGNDAPGGGWRCRTRRGAARASRNCAGGTSFAERQEAHYRIAITPMGIECVRRGLDMVEEAGTLTREQIVSGSWKDLKLRR